MKQGAKAASWAHNPAFPGAIPGSATNGPQMGHLEALEYWKRSAVKQHEFINALRCFLDMDPLPNCHDSRRKMAEKRRRMN